MQCYRLLAGKKPSERLFKCAPMAFDEGKLAAVRAAWASHCVAVQSGLQDVLLRANLFQVDEKTEGSEVQVGSFSQHN